MPIVQSSLEVRQVTRDAAWDALLDFSSYPDLLDNVISVDVTRENDRSMLSSWVVSLDGAEFAWEERDTLLPPDEIRFEQTEGDLDTWRGSWRLEETDDGVLVSLTVEFDIGIPTMSAVLDPIAEKAVQENSAQLLRALERTLGRGDGAGDAP